MNEESLWSKVKAILVGWVAPIGALLAYIFFQAQQKRKTEDKLAQVLADKQLGKATNDVESAKVAADAAVGGYESVRDEYLSTHGGDVPGGDPSVRSGVKPKASGD